MVKFGLESYQLYATFLQVAKHAIRCMYEDWFYLQRIRHTFVFVPTLIAEKDSSKYSS